MEVLDSFGEWMRRLREAQGLTRIELSECAGCSVSALRKIEADERRPSRQLAELLARCLSIRPEDLATFLDAARGIQRVVRLGAPVPKSARAIAAPSLSPRALANTLPDTVSWNLPSPATSLVGREAEMATLAQLLEDTACRLLTLVGSGGIGKTRLAIEVGCNVWHRFADGVYFCPLAAVGSSEFLVPALAQAVGLSFTGSAEPRSQLVNFLRSKQMLLLLDNLEHLLDGADVLVELLERAPGVKLLVTSRERLGLGCEWVFEVQGLPVPGEGQAFGLEKHGSIQLFLQRAQQARVGFEPSNEEWPDIVRICQMVEGMPLALELAATWVAMLTCAEIASEIERGSDILATRLRDVPERQRSMRAVFDHSWLLLTEEERQALSQLALFAGGFERAAAQAVAGANLSILSALLSKSLVRRKANGRYDLHELIRQFAIEHLENDAQLWAETRERYAAFHLALVEEAKAQLRGASQLVWLERLEQEHANLRPVLEWSLADDKPVDGGVEMALQMAVALRWFWYMRGYFHEGRDWLTKLLRRCPGERTAVYASALEGAGLLANALGEHGAAVRMAEESIAIYREVGDRQRLADALKLKGAALNWHGAVTLGNVCLVEALTLYREVGDRWGTACTLYELGRHLADFGGDMSGHAMLEESALILEGLGDKYTFSAVLISLGVVAIGRAEYAIARAYLERSLAMAQEIGCLWLVADALANLGYVLRLEGDYPSGRAYSEEALRIYQEGGSRVWEIDPLCALAESDIMQGQLAAARWRLVEVAARPEIEGNKWLQVVAGYLQGILAAYEKETEQAVKLLERTITLAAERGYKPDQARSLVALGRVKGSRGEQAEAVSLLQAGLHLFHGLGHKLGMVTAFEGLGEVTPENAAHAATLVAASVAARQAIGAPLPPVEHAARERLLIALRQRLGDQAFTEAWADGEKMSMEQAAAYALTER